MTTPDVRPLLKKALLRIEVLEDSAAKREAEKTEPIAVIGLACRFPGGGSNPEAFWQALENGVDAVRRTPDERWAKSTMPARDLDIQWASLLDDFQSFDASFFGISPREASQLDPQQRLVLEVVWEALENAGQDVHRLNGSKTGVFIGQSTMDYALLLNEHQVVDTYSSTGTTSSTTAGRVAFTFGFQGTCMTLDTACSSSLVAIHLACQSLRQKENDLVFAGGVNLILHPYTTSVIIKMKALSPDGRCKTFDSRANGFVRGEGCGVLALKRLSDAERDGDPIFAVIRGSAINHDGRSSGLTVPNMLAQRSMLRAALENARLKPEDIGYVETHGTGTALGDPIEFEALRHVLGQPRVDGSTCILGAVKTNVGHLEAAAGAAGIIKVIGALQRERIPKNLHFERLNPHISLEGTAFVLAEKQLPWTSKDKPRRAGVSSFGISGTNAHVILEQPPKDTRTPSTRQEGMQLVTLSAKTEEARLAMAKAYAENLSADNADSLADFAFSTNTRRTHHEYRLAVVGASKKDLAASLHAWAAGNKPADVVSNQIRSVTKLVFVFSGQGSQWIGMGRQLLIEEPAFRDALQACDAALRPHAGFSILEELAKPEATSRLNETEIAQPALFALEVALAKLFQTWGISPQMVIGHSVGEISAAHVAGILDLDQAARLVAIRARIMQKATGHGKMVSVAIDEMQAHESLRGFEQRVGIAAVNDPGSVVLSGDTESVDQIVQELAARGIDHRPLRVNYAFHSPQMAPLRDEFTAAIGRVTPSAGTIPMISTVTGTAVSGEKLDTTYWGNNIRQTVRLADAIGLACKTSSCTFVEIGPHAVLTASISQTIATNNSEGSVVPTLRRDKDERKQALLALGVLHVQGWAIQWSALFPGGGRVVPLPTYPWQKQRYWLESTAHKADLRSAGLLSAEHPWLAAITPLADGDGLLLTGRLSLSEQPWLADHAVFDSVLVPGTGLLELALAGARAVGQTSLSDLTMQAPLLLPRQGGVRIQMVIQSADAAGRRTLSLFSQAEEGPADTRWTRNATGILAENAAGNPDAELAVWPPPGAQAIAIADLYSSLSAKGYQYGPAFQGLTEVWRRGDVLFARAILPEALRKDAGEYGLHPALLDAALHALFTDGDPENENVRLPFAFSDVALIATGSSELRVRIELPAEAQGQTISLTIADGSGQPVARVGGLQVRPATAEQVRASLQSTNRDIYRVDWKPITSTENPPPIHGWVLGGDGRLAKELGLEWISNLEALRENLERSDSAPERLVVDFTTPIADEMPLPALVQRETAMALATLQSLLAEPRLSKTALIWLTYKTIATSPDDAIDDLARASLWGLIRSARSENPDRDLRLIDIDTLPIPPELFASAKEPELVWRYRTALAPRLQNSEAQPTSLKLPPVPHWRLHLPARGSLSDLELIESPDALVPLQSGQVRVAVRAAGVNFRDVLNALGMVPAPWLGLEFAGSVVEVGPGVEHVAVGDRIMGLGQATFATIAIADARTVTRIPEHLSYAEAATIPLVFLTALYALHDLANLQSGERLVVHAAAGGVGMAAIQLAHHWGVEVFGTASPSKWHVLRTLGLDSQHIANSRNLSFANEFLANTNGAGADVVLNALARDFVDASLRLLPRGGRFLEMGKTDIRDAEVIAAAHPGVTYKAFDLLEAGPDRIQAMLVQLVKLFEQKALRPLPVSAYDFRHAPIAFKHLANGRNVGKLILQSPRSMDSNGTALITGGTGELGQSLATHLVQKHGAKHLILTSRRGANAPGAETLVKALKEAGAETITLAACDVAKEVDVTELIQSIPSDKPLRAVFHLAGVVDDGLLTGLSEERLANALRPKVAGAWNLHQCTKGLDVSTFVMFSSVAGVIGNAGQANYAAANTFLDALAAHRRQKGLAGQSLAWGLWEQQGLGMTAHLSAADLARMGRQGFSAISVDTGMALLDAASMRTESTLVPIRIDLPTMQKAHGERGPIPALLRVLIQPTLRRVGPTAVAAQALRQSLQGLSENARRNAVLDLVRREIAAVLGLASADAVPIQQPLQTLGLDSLMAVELRNRLSARAETTLPPTLAFDYPTPDAIAGLLLRKAFADLETSATARVAQAHFDEPIAIVGMACRTPGGISDPEGFWTLLDSGRDATGPFPNRWDIDTLYDPNPDAIGKSLTREGGFLDDIAGFDAAFFGISPREALAMDPQQRLVLETAWEALERARINPNGLNESLTGVYLGSMGLDYGLGTHSLEALDGYRGMGTASSILAGRLAYILGLQGPAMTIDTACSSSLVAMHLAVTGLRQGECDLALAGGVHVMCTPSTFVEFSRLRGLAPDGRCKSFSAGADGVGWAEGCGVLVLKRLSDAKRDGNQVLAVLRGSAVNQDGRSNGLTAPNGPSQQRVIRRALATCGLLPADIDALEAHGTGTTLGDPIEAGALIEVFGPSRRPEMPLWLGSSKSNIGHSQAAAGVLGVMKMVLALQHERLPRTLHAEQPTPHIPWEGSGLRLLQEPQPWPRSPDRIRRAGISSFGLSGTNAHVILEEAPVPSLMPDAPARSAELVVLSAKTSAALDLQAKHLAEFLTTHPELGLRDIAYSLATTRSSMDHRLAIATTSREGLLGTLQDIIRGQKPTDAIRGTSVASKSVKVVFVFSGQGSQWVGMSRQLYREEPVFRDALAACAETIRKEAGFSILDELDKPEATSRIHETIVAQPALFAIEVALAGLLQSWGVSPSAVVGHSVGEIAAAHIAGILDLAEAARLVCVRARVMQKATGHGKMVSVSLDEQAANQAITGLEDRVGIAAINDPHSVVLSGDSEAIDSLVETFTRQGVQTRPLRVNYAFHSPQMEPLVAEFVEALKTLSVKPATIPMFSTVTGKPVAEGELDVAYWGRNIRQTVRFADAITTSNERVFVEVGPHPVLSMSIEQTTSAKSRDCKIIPTLRRDRDERKHALLAVGALHTHGIAIDWKAIFPDGGRTVELPTYPWQRERYWLEMPTTKKTVAAQVYDGFNTLIQATGENERWETYLTFGPLRDIVPGFSWMSWSVDADLPQQHREIVLDAQREMRRVLFRHVDFGSCKRVLDFGCGYATDLMVLAKRHSHLQFDGYTISSEQAGSDRRRVAQAGLEPRITIYNRDSAKDEFPGQYDVVFGFEVAHHIRDKNALFGNISRHLVEGGALVLADFISNGSFQIEHEETSSFFLTKEEWVDVLSPNGLEIVDCIDISQEVANFLHDPDFDAKLAQASQDVLTRYSRSALVSYDRLGKTLRRGWTSYILLSVRKNSNLSSAELAQRNQSALAQLIPYEVANPGPPRNPLEQWLFDVLWRRKELTNAKTLTETPGSWIVVSAQEATGATLAERLGKLERSCLHILTAGPYRQIGSDVFAIDSSSVNDWVRFFEENFRGEQKIAGIVDLSNLDAPAFTRPDELAQPCVNTTALVQALVRHGFRQSPRLFLVTRGAQSVFPDDEVSLAQTPILGLGKTIAMEHPELRCTRIDLPPGADEIDVEALLGELSSPTPEDQIALRKGARYVARLTRSRLDKSNPNETHRKREPARGRPYRLEMDRPGVLSRLAHYEMDKPEPAADEVVIAVEAAGLNFIDVFAATEAGIDKPMIPDGQTIRLGHECAGKIVAVGANVVDLQFGDEVIAFGKSAFGSFFVGRAAFVWKKDASWTWDQAATLPVSFLTAYYALEYLGRLRAGDRVLIHAGAGGVGLAAIQWAQHVGAEIFATAGSEEKRQYLRSLGVHHVFDSRSNEFVEGIKQVTAGEGVDVILNSLSGSLLTSSLSILADQGRFVDIGQRDSLGEQKTELRPFLRNSSFSRLDLLGLRDKRPEFVGRLLRELKALFEKGVFRPLPVQPFALAQAKDAFEFMAQAKHIGKIALHVANAPEPTIVPLHPAEVKVVRPDATYLITGGLGGLGLSVASWLVERGARHLVLVGRRSPSAETQMVIDAMTKAGANVRVVSADISQENDVSRILTMIRNEMPALAGIIHSAAVLDDHTLLEQTAESFHTVFAAKAIGAWHLHVHTQSEKLDFFVMYSSAASLLGSPGQANYCAANAFLDALARERVRLGLPGMSIQWGAFAEVGLAAARESRSARLANRGMTALTPADGLEILHGLLEHPHAEIGVLRLDIRQWIEFYPAATRLPFLTEILALEAPAQKDSTAAHQTLQKLQATTPEERSWLLEQLLADQLGLVLQLDPSRIDRSAPLQSLGLDSLMSLELRNRLEALVGVKLPATVTFTYPTMEALARHLLSELGLEFALTPAPSAPSKEASQVDDLAHLSDDELLRAGKEILG